MSELPPPLRDRDRNLTRRALLWTAVGLLVVAWVNCSSTPEVRGGGARVRIADGRVVTTPEGSMTFLVHAPEGEYVADVDVIAVTSEGLRELGKTDSSGALTLEVASLRELQPYVLIFCSDHFPCAALVVDEHFYGFRELDVQLARSVFY